MQLFFVEQPINLPTELSAKGMKLSGVAGLAWISGINLFNKGAPHFIGSSKTNLSLVEKVPRDLDLATSLLPRIGSFDWSYFQQ